MENIKKRNFLLSATELIEQVERITDEEISQNAFDFIKANRHKILSNFLEFKDDSKKAIFLAGSPGAGKTELATVQSSTLGIDRIDTDEIRKLCPYYSGINSHLFQKASSKGVSILMDKVFTKEYSFILDGNFSDLSIQRQNVERALSKGYEIELNFVYRPLPVARSYLNIREQKDGRHVSDAVFYQKFMESIHTIQTISKDYGLTFSLYDLNEKLVMDNLTEIDSLPMGNSFKAIQDDIESAKQYLMATKEHELER